MELTKPVELFDLNKYMNENARTKAINESTQGFQDVVERVKKYTADLLKDENKSVSQKEKFQEIEHQATVGDTEAETYLMNEIDDFLKSEQIINIEYPSCFNSLSHAIFHEIYRFGIFYRWFTIDNSPSAMIQGKEIWYKINGEFEKQHDELLDEEQVSEIIRALAKANKGLKVSEQNPEAEVEMKDGTRVTIAVPPRAHKPTIIFRRFLVNNFSFKEQAKRGTIAQEDIPLWKDLANSLLNTIIAGEVESGKSTFQKTIYSERNPKLVACLIEPTPESYYKRDFPERLVHEFYSRGSDINDVIRLVLRVDHNYLIVAEVRGYEAEGAISGTERGTRGLLMTYHITDPEKTPEQLAQHIVDVYPNRRLVNEIRRIAKQLDIGITMKTFENNQKRVTSMYEICYSYENDSAWINYLMLYNKDTDSWEYNNNISERLKERLYKHDKELADRIIEHLTKRADEKPMKQNPIQPIYFK
jgi:pilus assembly protein CpaF